MKFRSSTSTLLTTLISGMCLLLIGGCERTNQAQFFGLSTIVSVEVRTTPSKAKDFVAQLQQLTDDQQINLYAWGDGELATANKSLSNTECIETSDHDLMALLHEAKKLNRHSSGLFEPAIAPLVELWGFHDANKMLNNAPTSESIQQTLASMGSINTLVKQNGTLCPTQATSLDLGAIGKGWAARKTADLLHTHDVQNALIDFGGDLIIKGEKATDRAWRIGLRSPDQDNPPAFFNLKTKKTNSQVLAIFTSGDYERVFISNGRRYHHILDPRTGYPADKVRSVTVVHPDPVVADAAATALFIAGHDWQALAQKMSVQDVLVIYPDQSVEVTRSLHAKTSWLDDKYQVSVVTLE